jgi:hypothetical protein
MSAPNESFGVAQVSEQARALAFRIKQFFTPEDFCPQFAHEFHKPE